MNSARGKPILIGVNGVERFTNTKNVSGVREYPFWLMDNVNSL